MSGVFYFSPFFYPLIVLYNQSVGIGGSADGKAIAGVAENSIINLGNGQYFGLIDE